MQKRAIDDSLKMHNFEFLRKLIGEKVSTARIRFLMQVMVISFRCMFII